MKSNRIAVLELLHELMYRHFYLLFIVLPEPMDGYSTFSFT